MIPVNQWLLRISRQLEADAVAKEPASAASPTTVAFLGKRGCDIRAIAERAVKKIRDEIKTKAAQAEPRWQEFVRQAGIEYLRLSFGSKQKPAPNALQEKLGKACRCSKSLPPGNHKVDCNFHPANLRAMMRKLAVGLLSTNSCGGARP